MDELTLTERAEDRRLEQERIRAVAIRFLREENEKLKGVIKEQGKDIQELNDELYFAYKKLDELESKN